MKYIHLVSTYVFPVRHTLIWVFFFGSYHNAADSMQTHFIGREKRTGGGGGGTGEGRLAVGKRDRTVRTYKKTKKGARKEDVH